MQTAGRSDPASVALPGFTCPSDMNVGKQLDTASSSKSISCGKILPGNYFGVSGTTHHGCNGTTDGNGILFSESKVRVRDIEDGTSKTIIAGERGIPSDLLWGWSACGGTECEHYLATELGIDIGRNSPAAIDYFSSWHSSVANFVLADGSVRTLNFTIDQQVFDSLATRSGRESGGEL